MLMASSSPSRVLRRQSSSSGVGDVDDHVLQLLFDELVDFHVTTDGPSDVTTRHKRPKLGSPSSSFCDQLIGHEDDTTAGTCGSPSSMTSSSSSASSSAASCPSWPSSSTSSPAARGAKRRRPREQLLELRAQVRELEDQLQQLQQHERGNDEHAEATRLQQLTAQYQTKKRWQLMASEQAVARQRAEQENLRLRHLVKKQLRTTQRIHRIVFPRSMDVQNQVQLAIVGSFEPLPLPLPVPHSLGSWQMPAHEWIQPSELLSLENNKLHALLERVDASFRRMEMTFDQQFAHVRSQASATTVEGFVKSTHDDSFSFGMQHLDLQRSQPPQVVVLPDSVQMAGGVTMGLPVDLVFDLIWKCFTAMSFGTPPSSQAGDATSYRPSGLHGSTRKQVFQDVIYGDGRFEMAIPFGQMQWQTQGAVKRFARCNAFVFEAVGKISLDHTSSSSSCHVNSLEFARTLWLVVDQDERGKSRVRQLSRVQPMDENQQTMTAFWMAALSTFLLQSHSELIRQFQRSLIELLAGNR